MQKDKKVDPTTWEGRLELKSQQVYDVLRGVLIQVADAFNIAVGSKLVEHAELTHTCIRWASLNEFCTIPVLQINFYPAPPDEVEVVPIKHVLPKFIASFVRANRHLTKREADQVKEALKRSWVNDFPCEGVYDKND